jgi:hypothetical protein
MDEASERTQPAQESREVREVPHCLDVMHPGIDEQEVEGAGTNGLVGDMNIAVPGKPRFRQGGHVRGL